MPKLLTKGVTVREFYQDKKSTEEEQEPAKQSTLIENELRATLNELELSLNMSEVRLISTLHGWIIQLINNMIT